MGSCNIMRIVYLKVELSEGTVEQKFFQHCECELGFDWLKGVINTVRF